MIEILADRYEEEQKILQELNQEEFDKNFQPRQMNECERASLKAFNDQLENSFN